MKVFLKIFFQLFLILSLFSALIAVFVFFGNLYHPKPFCAETDFLNSCTKRSPEFLEFISAKKDIQEDFFLKRKRIHDIFKKKQALLDFHKKISEIDSKDTTSPDALLSLKEDFVFFKEWSSHLSLLLEEEEREIKSICLSFLNDEDFCSDPK